MNRINIRTVFALSLLLIIGSSLPVIVAENDVPVTNSPPQIVSGTITFVKQVIDTTVGATHVVIAAELTGDNEIDVVATDFVDGSLLFYENDGNGGFLSSVLDSNLAGAYPAHVGDVDGDGDIDVLAGGYEADTFAWYENQGAGIFSRRDIDSGADGPHSVVTVDMDGDGDIDLVTSSQDANNIAWYENDGTNIFSLQIIDGAADGAKRAEAADIDGDGDIDVVSASFFIDEIAWYENDGFQSFTKQIIDSSANGAYYVSLADVDGDGDTDVFAASQLDNTIAWYRNDGTAGFAAITMDAGAAGARTVIAVDMDSDGDVDALTASVDDNTIAWYRNDGSGVFAKQAIDVAALGAYGVFPIDMDHDGDVDVLSASRDANAVSLHTQIQTHVVAVDLGGTLTIDSVLLLTIDRDDGPAELVYTITSAPEFGALLLDDILLVSLGDTFTQADVSGGRLTYVHAGAIEAADGFSFMIADDGEDGVQAVAGIFVINVGFASPVVELRLNEGSGTTAVDASGMGNNGMLVDGAMFAMNTADGSAFSVRLDGVNDFIDLGVVDVNGVGLTLATWFNADSFSGPTNDPRLISKATGTSANEHLFMLGTIRAGAALRLRARVRVGGLATTLIASSGDLMAGEWRHAAVTYDGATLRLYLDAVVVGSTPLTGAVDMDASVAVAVGAQPAGTGLRFFDGSLDDVRILQRALSADEISGIVDGVGGNQPPLASNDGYVTLENLALVVNAASGVLWNDSDPDLDPLQAILVSSTSNGLLNLNLDGSFDYTPNGDFRGTDSFTYQTSDTLLSSNLATVTVTVKVRPVVVCTDCHGNSAPR